MANEPADQVAMEDADQAAAEKKPGQATEQKIADATVAGDATATEMDAVLADKAEAGGASERILNQDEIDNLLGFDASAGDTQERTGIQAIINSALVSYERLPLLEIVFDRLVRLMTTSLRNFTSDNVEVSLDNISSIRFGDYLNSIPLPAILSGSYRRANRRAAALPDTGSNS